MEGGDHLKFGKEMFVNFKRENINQNYKVHKELGKGAFGTVYQGVKADTNEERAIKKIQKAKIKDLNMLMNEIDICMSLDHPSIVKTYEIFEYNNNIYIVTDICEGGELFDRLDQEGSLSEAKAQDIFKQMVESVNYLHKLKIAHRDLKPENFLFLRKGANNLKLIDFGLAVRWKQSLRKELKERGEKKLVGTSYYLAPEIMNGEYDQRADIWSLGVILYILLSAVPPFDGDNDKQILESVKTMKYTFGDEFKGVSENAKDLIRKILLPAEQRASIQDIFNHPWMKENPPVSTLKLKFSDMHKYSKFSKLKKLAATFGASQISEKEVEELNKLFREIDVNHDGFISISELKQKLEKEGSWFEKSELINLMDAIDADKNGQINYTEFLASNLSAEKLFNQKNIKKLFDLLDEDKNGTIDMKELKSFFTDSQIDEIKGKSIEQIFKNCDSDNNGVIDYEEFKKAIHS